MPARGPGNCPCRATEAIGLVLQSRRLSKDGDRCAPIHAGGDPLDLGTPPPAVFSVCLRANSLRSVPRHASSLPGLVLVSRFNAQFSRYRLRFHARRVLPGWPEAERVKNNPPLALDCCRALAGPSVDAVTQTGISSAPFHSHRIRDCRNAKASYSALRLADLARVRSPAPWQRQYLRSEMQSFPRPRHDSHGKTPMLQSMLDVNQIGPFTRQAPMPRGNGTRIYGQTPGGCRPNQVVDRVIPKPFKFSSQSAPVGTRNISASAFVGAATSAAQGSFNGAFDGRQTTAHRRARTEERQAKATRTSISPLGVNDPPPPPPHPPTPPTPPPPPPNGVHFIKCCHAPCEWPRHAIFRTQAGVVIAHV